MQRITLKNAVLFKDMSIKAKRKNMALSLFVINIIIAVGFLFFILISNSSLANFESIDIQAFTWVFDGFIIVECAMICFMVPSETGPAISNERERQTLDVLLTTNMSNLDIILGKFISSVAYMLLTIVSLLPFLSIVLLYGGISFFNLIAVILSVIATAMYLSTFGIYFSTKAKKSSHATAMGLIAVFLIVIGSIIFTFTVKMIALGITSVRSYNGITKSVSGDWSMFIQYLNPASTVFDILDKYVGFNFGSQYRGMAAIISTVCDINPANFFVRHWAPVGFILQFITGCLVLKAAAASLTNVKRRNKRGKKKNN